MKICVKRGKMTIAGVNRLPGERVEVPSEGWTVGRSKVRELQIKDGTVARSHARLVVEQGSLWVEDLGSTNGTWVNDEMIKARRVLKAGDRVRFAAEFEFLIEE